MKCQITDLVAHDVSKPVNDVDTCFWIEAEAIVEKQVSEEDVDLSEELTSDFFNSSRTIAPFRTLLFPNSVVIMEKLDAIYQNAEKAIKENKTPKYPTINLNRFEKEVTPFFRRYMKTTDEYNAGDWILAQEGDETHPDDKAEKPRKLFKTIWVTCLCNGVDEQGNDKPAESVDRKAARAWSVGLEVGEEGFSMFNIAEEVLKLENKRAERKVGSDEEFNSDKKPDSRERRRPR